MFKRSLLPFLIAVTCCFGENAVLSFPDQALSPGQTVVASMSLASAGQPIASIQFDLAWDPSIALHLAPGAALQAVSKVPYILSLGPQQMRYLVSGLNQTVIADGELLKIYLSADPAAGFAASQIQITNVAASDPNGIPVAVNAAAVNIQIQSGTGAPLLPASAILNGASWSSGPLSPGEIITILGLNGGLSLTSLQINGVPAPVLFAGLNQINAVVPFGLDLTAPAVLQVNSQKVTVPVAPASPGIFTLNSTGVGPGAILNEDYNLNSLDNPARPGSVIMVYGTGFGTLITPATDGQPVADATATTALVTATVGGFPAQVTYAGAAPGYIAGLIQVNIQLPEAVVHRSAAPIVLTISGASTAGGATVAIQ